MAMRDQIVEIIPTEHNDDDDKTNNSCVFLSIFLFFLSLLTAELTLLFLTSGTLIISIQN